MEANETATPEPSCICTECSCGPACALTYPACVTGTNP